MRSEILHQLDLLVGERAHLLAIDFDDADQIVFLKHRNAKLAAHAGELNDWRLHRIVYISRHRSHVGCLNHLLGFQYTAKAGISGGPNKWRAPSGLSVFGRRAVQSHGAKRITFAEKNYAEICAAKVFGACQ